MNSSSEPNNRSISGGASSSDNNLTVVVDGHNNATIPPASSSSSPSLLPASPPSSRNAGAGGSSSSTLHMGEGSLDTASDLALMVGYKNAEELARRGGIEGVVAQLSTDTLRGITEESIPARAKRWGQNVLPPVQSQTFLDFVKEALDDRTMKILVAAAVVSLVLGLTTPGPRSGSVDYSSGWMEGTAILLSVVIVTLVAAVNNLQKQEQFNVVASAEAVAPVIVVREGNVFEISHEDAVVGDLVSIFAGMSLPFDALLVEGTGYSTNEASMTGEVDYINKSTGGDPFLASGTHIVDGCDGLAVVVAVGERSFAGSIAMSTREQKTETPLQEHLEEMADVIGRFGLAAAVLTFLTLLLKEIFMAVFVHGESFYMIRVFENLTTAVAIVVVAVPEGLPLSVTLSLAYSMKMMLADKNLVRHLAACETMGGATHICTDKTGTLTSNDMEMASIYFMGTHHTPVVSRRPNPQAGFLAPPEKIVELPNVKWSSSEAANLVLRKVADCIALNYCTMSAKANKTASALLDICSAVKAGCQYDSVAEAERLDKAAIQRFAFSSVRKRGSVVVAHQQQQQSSSSSAAAAADSSSSSTKTTAPSFLSSLPGPAIPGTSGVILTHYVAGAAEMILQKCASYVTPEGRRTALTGDVKAQLEDTIAQYASRGWRTLCIGLSERKANWSEPPKIAPDDPLVFLAIVGIAEPLRSEVPEAMLACRSAGVKTCMVTGDNLITATHIARSCNILEDNSSTRSDNNNSGNNNGIIDMASYAHSSPTSFEIVMDGATFREKTDDDLLNNVVPRLRVLARASPLDKKRLIHLLKQDADAVVAVTGDGTNDAPALKAADVGFAMNSGSDIAKRSSDIVLLDDNFKGVVKAIVWGRNVRDNIKKFLQFQLTVNGVACLVAFLGALVNTQNLSPLKPVQLLWLNLIMDTFAALALATELPHDRHLLSRGPEPRTASIISPAMRTNIAAQGIFQLVVQLLLLVVGEHLFTGMVEFSDIHITIVFNVFVMMQVFNFFNARKLTHQELALSATAAAVGTPSIVVSPSSSASPSSSECIGAGAAVNNNNNNNNNWTDFADEVRSLWTRSSMMLYIIATIIATQVFIVQYGGKFMSTVPLDSEQWVVCIIIASFSLPVGIISRRMGGRSSLAHVSTRWFVMMLDSLTKVENAFGRMRASVAPAVSREKQTV